MSSEVDGRLSPLSRVLFLSDSGEPMRFFMRPGPTKAQLQPIICAGGGVVCRVQEPGTILLSDLEDMAEVPASAAHRYVSAQYVRDCAEKNEQLEVEDYRFRGESERTRSAKRKREGSVGRVGYTAEEDAAILSYVRGRAQEVRGNLVWQRMEREKVTSHSWQSMKDRYRKFLVKQQQEPLEEDGGGREKVGVKDGPLDDLLTKPMGEKEPAQSVREKDPPPPSPEKANKRPQPTPEITGNSVEREAAGPSCMSTGRNEQLVVTEEVEKEEHISARKRRKLGILERAVKEFESDESDDDDTPDIVLSRTTQSADPKGAGEEIGVATEVTRENGGGDDDHDNESSDSDNEPRSAAQPGAAHVQRGAPAKSTGREDGSPGQGSSAPLTSNVHMFLFDQDTQEEELCQPARDTPFSQAQLEEAKRQLRYLMTQSKQGLVSVTKSLLKTSGDVPAALQYLLTGQGPPGATLWDPRDDSLLLSADPSQRELHEKYGKVSVAKRIAFLSVE
ncbi:hypothetical protein AAFF_G00235120 [Aldrovandia affinis]|uniref:Telomeric repeat-binding factor 2-interacting protein 1 n=1 Tax=Aldrovandia affinis TaxID=143900 RepID=A0AAD7SUZ7_9TELE|nr:hypothetical protein AAFF_G00235120 [Aldrovandia affinis]